ncbi:MAG: hypothetical protein JSV56_11635 [Methanomassiliicoccales archaeon]|nr:MAG: hypothetical protein JSV56_11635 [Methanomassiliicoccales archaeon]
MEKKMFAIKVPAKEKDAMDLVARETRRTLANIYFTPIEGFIHESLGAIILGRLDEVRGNERKDEVIRYLLNGSNMTAKVAPTIIKDFIKLMTVEGGGRKFKMLFSDLNFSDKSFLLHEIDLHELARHLGQEYLERGGSLNTIELELAYELFFERMLSIYYSLTAEGSLDVLHSAWNDNYPKISMFKNSLLRDYKAKYGKSFVEILEVEPEYEAKKRFKKQKSEAI